MKTIYLLIAFMLVAGSPAFAQHTVHSIGYIGCSNTRDSVTGYHAVSGNKNYLWPSYGIDRGRIDLWAKEPSSYWTLFQSMVNLYGTPRVVWVELCENAQQFPNSYAQVVSMLGVLKQKVATAIAYISAINGYNPTLCSLMGNLTPTGLAQANADTNAWASKAVSDGLAQAGPVMGPLTPQLVKSDNCHPNQAGMELLGQQLHDFFDTLN